MYITKNVNKHDITTEWILIKSKTEKFQVFEAVAMVSELTDFFPRFSKVSKIYETLIR